MGGSRLKATGRCIFAMRVEECLTFDEYWNDPRFRMKRPIRNGSKKMVVGDNIYHRESEAARWQQEDSHHSSPDGSLNLHNLESDTQTNRILASQHFVYFGAEAPTVPPEVLAEMGYQNGRSHRVFHEADSASLLSWLDENYRRDFGIVLGDPFDFEHSSKRYLGQTNRLA